MFYILMTGGILAVIAVVVLWYYGGFYTPKISESHQGGEVLVYKRMKGTYRKTPKTMNEVYYHLLSKFYVSTQRGGVVYYDDPREKEEGTLRADVGCIIDNMSEIDDERMASIRDSLGVRVLTVSPVVQVEAPYRGRLSVYINMLKVYPKLSRYFEHNEYEKGPLTEIYDVPNNRMIYRQHIIGYKRKVNEAGDCHTESAKEMVS